MQLDCWIGLYKVRSFPWIDGKTIYVNVQCYTPGQSISQPPMWDKTVYVEDTEKGRKAVFDFTDSLVNYIATINIPQNGKTLLKFKEVPTYGQ